MKDNGTKLFLVMVIVVIITAVIAVHNMLHSTVIPEETVMSAMAYIIGMGCGSVAGVVVITIFITKSRRK